MSPKVVNIDIEIGSGKSQPDHSQSRSKQEIRLQAERQKLIDDMVAVQLALLGAGNVITSCNKHFLLIYKLKHYIKTWRHVFFVFLL